MSESRIVLLLVLAIITVPVMSSFDAASEEEGSKFGFQTMDPNAPVRGGSPRTSSMIYPGADGSISSGDNLSSDNGIAFTFERNSLEQMGSLPATFQTTQDQNNGRVIVTSGYYTFVSHIIQGSGWISFWLSRYDSRIDRWDQPVEVHNVTGYISAGCELAIAGDQLFCGIYLTSSMGADSGIYIKQIDLDSWAFMVNAVAVRLDTTGHVSKGGKVLTVDNDLLVFWLKDDANECYMCSYRDLAWSSPIRVLPEAVEIMPGTRGSSKGTYVYLAYRKTLDDGLNVSVSPNGGVTWPANYNQGTIFTGTGIQLSSAVFGDYVYILAVDRNNGLGRVYRSDQSWVFEKMDNEFDLGSVDGLDGKFQGQITADRSQVVVAFEDQDRDIKVFASKDQGSSFTSMGTFGNSAWCPAFDQLKNYMAYYQDGRLFIYRFATDTSGSMTTVPLSPMGISSWDDFGFNIEGFGPGSSLEMRVLQEDGVTQLFPTSGYLDVLSLGSGSIDGVAYSSYGKFSGVWASGETLIDTIVLEVRATRSMNEFPAILGIALNHTNAFPINEPMTRRDHIVSMTNMTYAPGGITLQDMRSKGEIVLGPIERENDWCDVIGIETYSNSQKVSFRMGLLNDDMRSISGFALKDSIIVSQPGQVHFMRWGTRFLKDLPSTLDVIYVLIEVGTEEPTARPGVKTVLFDDSQKPTVDAYSLLDPEVLRGETALLSLDVSDREEPDTMLTLSVFVKDPDTDEMSQRMDRGQLWSTDHWIVPLETSYTDAVGKYRVVVIITDSMGDRQSYDLGPILTITNNHPAQPGIYILPDIPETGDELDVEIYREGSDPETPSDQLSYTYRIYRDDDLYLEVDETDELNLVVDPGLVKEGEHWRAEVTTWDGLNESSPAISEVTIFNTVPDIAEHPDNITMLEDNISEAYDPLSWFHDKDLETLDLEFTIDEGFELVLQNDSLRIRPVKDFNGQGLLVVKASDEEGSARVSIPLVVLPVNDPPMIENVNETSVIQGEWLQMTIHAFDLSDGDNVVVTNDIDVQVPGVVPGVNYMRLPNGSFELFAMNEMVGSHTITVEASDGVAVVNTTFVLTVVNSNDGPLKPGIIVEQGRLSFMEDETIDLISDAYDPDIPWGDVLSYSWSSNIDGHLGDASEINVQLTPGTHLITLEISDQSGLKNTSTITIEVSPLPPGAGEVMSTSTLLLLVGIISFVIGLVIALIIFIAVKRKRASKENSPEAPSDGEVKEGGGKDKEKDTGEEGMKDEKEEGAEQPPRQDERGGEDASVEGNPAMGGGPNE